MPIITGLRAMAMERWQFDSACLFEISETQFQASALSVAMCSWASRAGASGARFSLVRISEDWRFNDLLRL